jgi:hypothetical protein
VFAIVGGSIALLGTTSILHAVVALVLVVAAGTLFWFLIKAMARIQMPQRPGADSR